MSDLISLIGVFVFGVLGWITYKIYIWPVYITPLRKIPGPQSESLFLRNIKRLFTEEDTQLKWIQKYGNVSKFHGIFNQPTLLISDTRIIQEITLNHVYDFIKPPHLSADAIAMEMIPVSVRVASILKSLIEDKSKPRRT
ncbi:hypothetical protein RclHR1_00670004 [Rhizophagus clarus]|uniref:Cytochrome P450 n=1 Tax=Rhizophagus clarus TaxID=94130 RepID=A0A2Z6SAQ9_9GLOM|nr:hypothetical protein RclHR1_00670004 [Rhizophagus clarus]